MPNPFPTAWFLSLGWSAGVTASPRIVVADDDPLVRRCIACTLLGHGYSVDETTNGAELLDTIAEIARARVHGSCARIDLVITDVNMPRFSGWDVLECLRRSGWDLPVILMSGNFDDAARGRARAIPCFAAQEKSGLGSANGVTLLEKPFSAATLLEAVRAHVPGSTESHP